MLSYNLSFCILEKPWIVCSPASLQAKKVLRIQFMCLWLYVMRWNAKVETCVDCWLKNCLKHLCLWVKFCISLFHLCCLITMFISLKFCISLEEAIGWKHCLPLVFMWLNSLEQTQLWITIVIISLEDKWTILSLLEDKKNCKFRGVC